MLYKNLLRAYEITKTDYFCVLDPDDFWIDKHKIQKALDFLEKNKDYTIYVTDTNIQTKDGKIEPFINRDKVYDSDFNDYLNQDAYLGCTVGSTFRNVLFKNGIPKKMQKLENSTQEHSYRGDSFRRAIHLHEGKAHCIPEVVAIYRVTDEGPWQGSSKLKQDILNAAFFKDLWLYYDKKYPEILVNSFKIYNQAMKNMLDNLYDISDSKIRSNSIDKLKDLKFFYDENQKQINHTINKHIKQKYKLMLHIYKKLHNKLSKKGYI